MVKLAEIGSFLVHQLCKTFIYVPDGPETFRSLYFIRGYLYAEMSNVT